MGLPFCFLWRSFWNLLFLFFLQFTFFLFILFDFIFVWFFGSLQSQYQYPELIRLMLQDWTLKYLLCWKNSWLRSSLWWRYLFLRLVNGLAMLELDWTAFNSCLSFLGLARNVISIWTWTWCFSWVSHLEILNLGG